MRKRTFFEKILFYLSVPKCACCREPLEIDNFGLCKKCIPNYIVCKQLKCSQCAKVYSECNCPNEFLDKHYIHKLYKLLRYTYQDDEAPKAANTLIYRLKSAPRRDIAEFIAEDLAPIINRELKLDDYIITSVPRSKIRKRIFGHDHAEYVAKALAKRLGIEYVNLLISDSKRPQKELPREERYKNVSFDYLKRNTDLSSKRVIIYDDVVTTGASMGACAMLIRGLGAKGIVGACMGIAYQEQDPMRKNK